MAKAKDYFTWDSAIFARARQPMREVVSAYELGNRFFDTVKEYVYAEQGLIHCHEAIHRQAHAFLKELDRFTGLLHQRHLMAEYPPTPELDWRSELRGMDDVFDVLLRAFGAVQEALETFRKAVDTPELRPMALFTEELMLSNSAAQTRFLEMWYRWDDDGGSKTSFDSWCKSILGQEVYDEQI